MREENVAVEERERGERHRTRCVVIRLRREGEEEEEKEGGVERTGYRLHLMSMGRGIALFWFYWGVEGWRGCQHSGLLDLQDYIWSGLIG
jgi:hypothetical protein